MVDQPKNVFVYSRGMDEYAYPPQIPFDTSRAAKTRKILNSMSLLSGPDRMEVVPELPNRSILEKFHSARYLDTLEQTSAGRFSYEFFEMGLGTGDCPIFRHLYDYVTIATGATITAAKEILAGRAKVAFNPSGGFHHAHPSRASGFCYINDVVLGIMTLTDAGKRILFVDIDVHHSDGVQEAFYDRPDVLTISFHQSGRTLFPGTGFPDEMGTGDGFGYSVNCPLPPGTYDEVYMDAFRRIALPLIEVYDPDVIAIEIGADALAGDPLAQLRLTNNTHADIVELIRRFHKPILATGGGGYHIDNTTRTWALCYATLCGDSHPVDHLAGMGGVMMQSSEWQSDHTSATALRDRVLMPDQIHQKKIPPLVDAVIDEIKKNIFPIHGLP
ncbi:MAG: acetoin utilization protein AcuC [Pirellulales bacterium]|nr:acetoin utilization protein AcuC [Pirellulales bacterium]